MANDAEGWTDEDEITFGKYCGTKMKDVPASYLLWLWNNGLWRDERDPCHIYIRKHMSALETDAPDVIVDHKPKQLD